MTNFWRSILQPLYTLCGKFKSNNALKMFELQYCTGVRRWLISVNNKSVMCILKKIINDAIQMFSKNTTLFIHPAVYFLKIF